MLVEKEILKIDQVDWLKDHIELYTSSLLDHFLVKRYINETDSFSPIYSLLKSTMNENQELNLIRILPFPRKNKRINELKEKKAVTFSGEFKIRSFSLGESTISFSILYKIRNLAEFEELEIEMNKINSYFLISPIKSTKSVFEKLDSSIFHNINDPTNIVNTINLLLILEKDQGLLKLFPNSGNDLYLFTTDNTAQN